MSAYTDTSALYCLVLYNLKDFLFVLLGTFSFKVVFHRGRHFTFVYNEQ